MPSSSPDATALSIPEVRAAFDGRVLVPGDPGYDQARTLFYGGMDKRPAVIVRPVDAAGVAQVVNLARGGGLELAVRSGGHSTVGHSTTDGGVLLDLSAMRALEVDPQRRTAWAQTGLTAGQYSTAAAAYGLATGFGDTASVGIGGITLGGGVGYLVRKHGLTIDDLLAAELITADGRLLHTDSETHPELFWAIRGGGGNFGVATRFNFRLHPLDTIVGWDADPAGHAPGHQRLRRRGAGRTRGAVDHRQHHARPAPTGPASRAARPAGHHGHAGLRRQPQGRRTYRGAVPGAGHPARRPGPADALPGDLPAGGGQLPPHRGDPHHVRRRH